MNQRETKNDTNTQCKKSNFDFNLFVTVECVHYTVLSDIYDGWLMVSFRVFNSCADYILCDIGKPRVMAPTSLVARTWFSANNKAIFWKPTGSLVATLTHSGGQVFPVSWNVGIGVILPTFKSWYTHGKTDEWFACQYHFTAFILAAKRGYTNASWGSLVGLQ